jgi:uncharacterized membrane protein
MNHSFLSFKTPLRAVPSSVVIIGLIAALIGFADASYLTIEHYKNVIPPCSVGGCETVLTSSYSTVAGIPEALLGAIYYLVILVGLFAYLDTKKPAILKWTLIIPILGFIYEVWLVYLQLFVIHSICEYCMLSALVTLVLFCIAVYAFSRRDASPALPE